MPFEGDGDTSDCVIVKVRIIPNSKAESVEELGQADYKIKVREKAIDGKANIAVIAALSSYFNVRKSDVVILKGAISRDKTIEIKTR